MVSIPVYHFLSFYMFILLLLAIAAIDTVLFVVVVNVVIVVVMQTFSSRNLYNPKFWRIKYSWTNLHNFISILFSLGLFFKCITTELPSLLKRTTLQYIRSNIREEHLKIVNLVNIDIDMLIFPIHQILTGCSNIDNELQKSKVFRIPVHRNHHRKKRYHKIV